MVCCKLDTMATTASILTAEIESLETDRRYCCAISTPQPSSERPAVDDTRVLRRKERKALSDVLKSLDNGRVLVITSANVTFILYMSKNSKSAILGFRRYMG